MIKRSTYLALLFLLFLFTYTYGSNISNNNSLFKDSLYSFTAAEFDTAKQYELQEILIKDSSPTEGTNYSSTIQKIRISDFISLNSVSLGDVLKLSSGIFVKSYGAEGSLQTISIRGTGAEYSSVSLNGMDLSNSLSGYFDFSSFSTEEFSRIDLTLGSDFNSPNSSSFNGGISLDPFQQDDSIRIKLKYTKGSFGLNSYSAGFNHEIPNSKISLDFHKKTAGNDFTYKFDGKTFQRENADLDQSIIKLTLLNNFKISNTYLSTKTLARYSEKELGLPGFIATNKHEKNNVRQSEKNRIIVTNLEWFFNNSFSLNSVIGLNLSYINISDPQSEINLRSTNFNSSNKNFNLQLNSHYFGKAYSFSVGINSTIDNFSFDDGGLYFPNNTSLKRISHSLSAVFSKQITLAENSHKIGFNILLNNLFLNSKNSKDNNSNSNFNYKFGLGYSPFSADLIRLFANYSFGARLPNFYEMYYSKLNFLSSSNLKKEIIKDFETGLSLNLSFFTSDIMFFHRDIKDKIVWYANRIAIFTPRNAGRIKSNGLEVRFSNIHFTDFLAAKLNYTYTNVYKAERLSESDQTFGKQLIYIPKHNANLILSVGSGNLKTEFSMNFFSKRYYSEDNDPAYVLPQVALFNFAINYRTLISKFIATFQF
ncbi:MAG: TonB-dependent receptor plug domain-containing protein, partial [Bacteroidetes bacterium]|nr:TonB-dependent receptor plug domain-containing protein [Bacteroidota bacterium]